MPADDVSRPLTVDERRLLDGLLAHDFPGVAELRVQALGVRATGGCGCGCGTIDLVGPQTGPRSEAANPAPVEGVIRGADGATVGGVLLFVSDGLLGCLEACYFDDPSGLPHVERVTWVGGDR